MPNSEFQPHHQRLIKALSAGAHVSPQVLMAFKAWPRHLFLPDVELAQAFADEVVPLKYDTYGNLISSSSQPTMMAIMLEQMHLRQGENVLEIGSASGYNAALIRHLVGEGGHVTTLEFESDLARQAEQNLVRAGVEGVRVVHADAAMGYAPRAAYDCIVSTAGVFDVPQAWVAQLRDDGRLVVPIWLDGVQVSACFIKQPDGTLLSDDNRPCSFVYLRGAEAPPRFRKQVGRSGLYLLSEAIEEVDTVALHTLLSADHEMTNFSTRLHPVEFWYGLQLYLLLNTPDDAIFALYDVDQERPPYGLDSRGVAFISRTSAAFAPYELLGAMHTYGGSDMAVRLNDALDDWLAAGRPGARQLRLRLIPNHHPHSDEARGRTYQRKYHRLHVWFEADIAFDGP